MEKLRARGNEKRETMIYHFKPMSHYIELRFQHFHIFPLTVYMRCIFNFLSNDTLSIVCLLIFH